MKRINVVTYCTWTSYGSILQALGLQTMIKALGHEGCVLSQEPKPADQLAPVIPKTGTLRQRIVDTHKLLNYFALNRKYRNTNTFIQSNIPIHYSEEFVDKDTDLLDADVYLTGSDQVWNPDQMNPFFFLDFVPNGKTRISYAASMGKTTISKEKLEQFRKYLDRFSYISVREPDNQMLLESLTNKQVQRHIDPVFLLSQEQWRAYETEYPHMEGPYILVYPIYWDAKLNAVLKKLHRQTGMKVVVLSSSRRKIYANRWIYDADPGQFLWLIDHANMVITSSFHGAAISIIFEKCFSAVVNPGMPSRINGLLEVLGVSNTPIETLSEDPVRDYSGVRDRILYEQERSRQYLIEALNNHA